MLDLDKLAHDRAPERLAIDFRPDLEPDRRFIKAEGRHRMIDVGINDRGAKRVGAECERAAGDRADPAAFTGGQVLDRRIGQLGNANRQVA